MAGESFHCPPSKDRFCIAANQVTHCLRRGSARSGAIVFWPGIRNIRATPRVDPGGEWSPTRTARHAALVRPVQAASSACGQPGPPVWIARPGKGRLWRIPLVSISSYGRVPPFRRARKPESVFRVSRPRPMGVRPEASRRPGPTSRARRGRVAPWNFPRRAEGRSWRPPPGAARPGHRVAGVSSPV